MAEVKGRGSVPVAEHLGFESHEGLIGTGAKQAEPSRITQQQNMNSTSSNDRLRAIKTVPSLQSFIGQLFPKSADPIHTDYSEGLKVGMHQSPF